MGRAVVTAVLVSLVGAAVIVALAGVLAQTTGLLAVAGIGGIAIGRTLRTAGDALAAPARLALSIVFALDMVILGNLGTWAFAIAEGGVLGPIDYLAETFGPLVPIELAVASVAGWLAAR